MSGTLMPPLMEQIDEAYLKQDDEELDLAQLRLKLEEEPENGKVQRV